MSRGRQRVKQREVTRIMRAVDKSGVPAQIKIDLREEAILIIPSAPAAPNNDLDEELAAFEARRGQS